MIRNLTIEVLCAPRLGSVAMQERTDIQRMSFRIGDPVLIDFDQFLQCLDAEIDVEFRHCQTLVGVVQDV